MARRRSALPRRPDTSNYGGLIEMRRCRATGTFVGLYDTVKADMDQDTPYATVCETHGQNAGHDTLSRARSSMAFPEWCEDCHPKLYK